MRILPVAAALSLIAAPVAAQPGAPAPMPPPPPSGPVPEAKSAGTGVGLAVAGSIIPAVGFGVGLALEDDDAQRNVVLFSLLGGLVLPGAGMYYAGKKKTIGAYPRGAALVALGLAALFDGLGADDEEADRWYGAAAALYGVGCIIDIATTPAAVREYNARAARPAPVVLAPTAVPGGAGLALTGQF